MFTGYNFFWVAQMMREHGYNGQDKMAPIQFITMGVFFALLVTAAILLRKVKKEKILLIFKIMCIVVPIGEIIKISFSTYGDLSYNEGFNLGGILPLYTCSMIMYFLPFVAWGKGKMKEYSMAFFCTIGLVSGLSNFVYLSAAGWYPIFSYGGLYSVFFHGYLVFVALVLMICGFYKVTWKSILHGMIPVLIMSAVVIPANLIIYNAGYGYVDYMMLMECNGFSPFADWAHAMRENGLQWLFSLFVLLVLYPIATGLIAMINMGIAKLVQLFQNMTHKHDKQDPVAE